MSDKPRWTRERKPKPRVVHAEVGKRQLRDQLRAALEESARLRERVVDLEEAQAGLWEENARLRAYAKYADQVGEELGRLREQDEKTLYAWEKDKAELAKWRLSFPQGPGVSADKAQALVEENARLREEKNAIERNWLQQETELQELRQVAEDQHAELAKLRSQYPETIRAEYEDELASLRQELHQAKAEWFEEKTRAREAEEENARLREENKRVGNLYTEGSIENARLREALEDIAHGKSVGLDRDEVWTIARNALKETR